MPKKRTYRLALSEHDEQYILDNYDTMSQSDIAKHLNLTQPTVSRRIRDAKAAKRKEGIFDEDAFFKLYK